jgi:BA14K-like protein
MTSLKTMAAAALLSVMAVTPVFAQAAIQEPGLFAFYHPYLDVLNGGAPTPAARLASEPPAAMEAYAARESGIAPSVEGSRAQRYRSYDSASGIFIGREGRRHRRG